MSAFHRAELKCPCWCLHGAGWVRDEPELDSWDLCTITIEENWRSYVDVVNFSIASWDVIVSGWEYHRESDPFESSVHSSVWVSPALHGVVLHAVLFPRCWLPPKKKRSVESISYHRCATEWSDPMILMAKETSTMGGRTSTLTQ